MSRIRRLSIRGIRNFGDESEESTIKFTRPLTLILGPNGTGKTTIIESLKYATTGEFPPGSDRGKYFVHDPSLAGAPHVKGAIKAEILDSEGNIYTICRTVQCTQTRTKLQFKTLDNTFTRENKITKKKCSITNRCGDVDAEIAMAMGVSKPILNYVIFCHQDELSWPLDEGQKLKKRFDEIFDSSQYNKALEAITDQCKKMRVDLKVTKAEKGALEVIVNEVDSKQSKLEESKTRLEECKTKINNINQDLQPLIKKIQYIEEQEKDYKELSTEYEKKSMEINVITKQMESLKLGIKEVFAGTIDQLNDHLNDYDNILVTKNKEIKECQSKLQRIAADETKYSNMLGQQKVAVGTLKQQLHDYERKTIQRNSCLNAALAVWKLDPIDKNVTEFDIAQSISNLKEKQQSFDRKVEEDMLTRKREEKGLQNTVDQLISTKSMIESEMNLREKEMTQIREDISQIRAQILQIGQATGSLNLIESKLEEANNEVEKVTNSLDVAAVKQMIRENVDLKKSLELQLNDLDEEIASLHKHTSVLAEIELHKSSLSFKEDELENIRNKREDDVKILLGVKELPQNKLMENLDHVQKQMLNQVKQITDQIKKEQRELTSLETTLVHKEREMKHKLAEFECDKEKISLVCDYKNFDEHLLLQSTKVKDLQDRRGMLAYEVTAYKQYLEKLKRKDPCCPLCSRNFSEEKAVTDLIKKMQDEMENCPTRLKKCETELKVEQVKYDTMLELKPIVEKVNQFEKTVLKSLSDSMEQKSTELVESRTRIEDLEMSKIDPESKLSLYKEVIGDVVLWDRCIDDMEKLNATIDDVQSRLSDTTEHNRTMEQAQEERENLNKSLTDTRRKIDKLQQQINAYNEKIQKTRDERNALHEEQLKMRSDMQKLKQLRDKQNELYERESSLVESVDSLRVKLESANENLDAGVLILDNAKKENWEKQESERKLAEDTRRHLYELQKIQDEIDSLASKNIPEAISRSELRANKYDEMLVELAADKTTTEKELDTLKQNISRQEIRKRELTDTITLRKIEMNVEQLKQERVAVRENLDSINHKEIQREWDRLKHQEDELVREKNVARGNLEELERVIVQSKIELRKENYRTARQRYTDKYISMTIQEEMIIDFQTYSKALDRAMIEYHQERMATVNRIIKRMWSLVYAGTDTTSIQIRTDATDGVGGTRRVYNYKLTQTKHGQEVDMRGRCSAGQRVLASIIIRLALAETFCKNCGILALDEPTTNLDEENANNLAEALTAVVRARSPYQKNFQLIVISHDEKFLRKLAAINDNKGFYELYRKYNGHTAVRHCDVHGRETQINNLKQEIVTSEEEEEEEDGDEEGADKDGSANNVRDKPGQNETVSKKRVNYESSDNEVESRPSKKRFILDI